MSFINEVFKLHELAMREGRRYAKRREIYEKIEQEKGRHFIGITGLRGVGKSVILKQLALEYSDSIYLSLDTLRDVDLFELVMSLNEDYKIKTFLLDEVHFVKNVDGIFKKIYDFLDVRLVFTSSISLGMFQSAYDLSRRVKLLHLRPFSFKEYLFFKFDQRFSSLSMNQIINKEWTTEHLASGYLFDKYLKGGNMPFALNEPDVHPLLENILKTIVHKDAPKISGITTEEVEIIFKMVVFIGKSGVDGINYSSLSRNLGITKYKAQSYVSILEKAFVLNIVMPTGTNVLKEPKVLMTPPFRLLFSKYDDCLGGLREDFFIEMLINTNYKFNYLKSTRGAKTPDFLILENEKKLIVEIGGPGKGREQFKGIDEKKSLILSHGEKMDGIRRPLFMAGFLETV